MKYLKDYVKTETEKAGLKWKDVKCLIEHESNFREFAIWDNKNGQGVDRGLWMWNSYWNSHISNECAFDYQCATKEALKKIKRDGGYGSWYGFNQCK